MKQVCIIGAGSSGISAAKTLKEKGISFDCFEKGSNIGGVWRFNNDNGTSSAYRSLHINTNRKAMAYSDFPMPDHYPMFPHHSHIIDYFDSYVDHFDIRKEFTFNTSVINVSAMENNVYSVTLDNQEIREYQHVIVANGHHWNPRFPDPPFPGQFTGEVLHSHHYKESDQVKNKNVLVVGFGNSAVDIACEAARLHTGKVVISTRSGAHIAPNWIWSTPFDSLINPLTSLFPLWLQRIFLGITLWLAHGNQEDYGIPKPKRPLLKEHPTLSQDLLLLSGRGAIQFKPNIKEFRGKTVVFEDDSQQEFDTIIYATGYKVTFPFLKHIPDFDVEENNNISLYKKVIHPDHKNLFFLALIQPLGAVMPLAEIQSKWIAKLIEGKCSLASKKEMLQSIEKEKQKMKSRYGSAPRHTLQVDFFTYKRAIKNEMKRK